MTLRIAGQALGALGVCAMLTVCTLYVTKSTAQRAEESLPQAERNASPIYGITIPAGYRDWRLISVARLAGGKLKQRPIGQRYCDEGLSRRDAPVPGRHNHCRTALG